MDKFLEKFPLWAVSIQDKKSPMEGYLFLPHKSGVKFLPVFTSYELAQTFVTKNNLPFGLAAFDTPTNLLVFLESQKVKKTTHIGFDPRAGGEVDLFSIDEAIEMARNKSKEFGDEGHNGKPA
jgi:hypothetical protein